MGNLKAGNQPPRHAKGRQEKRDLKNPGYVVSVDIECEIKLEMVDEGQKIWYKNPLYMKINGGV